MPRSRSRRAIATACAAAAVEPLERRALLSAAGTVFYSTDFDGNRVGDANAA